MMALHRWQGCRSAAFPMQVRVGQERRGRSAIFPLQSLRKMMRFQLLSPR